MLGQPHIRPLVDYAHRLGSSGRGHVPHFDPLDGGVSARLLFLFEKPGPKTFPPTGSGFIGRNNGDPTAAATHAFMLQAGIPRSATVIWNVIPWWDGRIKMTSSEKRDGATELPFLFDLLPFLQAIIFVGKTAFERGIPHVTGRALRVFRSAHRCGSASPLEWGDAWREIQAHG